MECWDCVRQPYKEYLMKKQACVLVTGAVALSLAIGFVAVATSGAADDKGDLKTTVQKIADAIEKKDLDEAKKLAEDVAKNNELEEVMQLMNKRDPLGKAKGRFGVGKKPGSVNPDGIEAKIISLGKKAQPQRDIDKESADLVVMAYRIAAIAEVAHAKPPEKDEGKKKKKDWMEWTGDMEKNAIHLADAAKAKKPKDIKTAAANLNTTCNTCHATFREQ
jgi:hypothetical protein